MEYRREIDGLRAVAVVPVILFHAGLSVFPGGYAGVDVFFVISGYLITTLILNDVEGGRFSIARFYERRARRILPALFVVVAVTLPLAFLVMLPTQLRDLSESMAAVGLFLSNFYFLSQISYFAPSAELQPLLHTWSLAVEEQFYLLFPLAFVMLWRRGRGWTVSVLAVAAVLSLILAQWAAGENPPRNFYFTGSRIWELLAGTLAAIWLRGRPVRGHGTAAGIGLVMILASMMLYDDRTPFPSLWTLLPVAGTVIVIGFAGPGTAVARLLSLRGFVGIGLISYSAYLWHQPLFALARIYQVAEPPPWVMVTLSLGSFMLAGLTWAWVEQPFRRHQAPVLPQRRQVFAAAGLMAVAFLTIGLIGRQTDGFERLWRAAWPQHAGIMDAIAEAQTATLPHDDGACRFNVEAVDDAVAMRLTACAAQHGPGVAVLGDSHAMDIFNVISGRGDQPFVAGFTKPSCRPATTDRECPYTSVEAFLPAHPDTFAVVIFTMSGAYLLAGADGQPGVQSEIQALPLDVAAPDLSVAEDEIALVTSYLVDLAKIAPVVWLGPRTEPQVRLDLLLGRGCAAGLAIRGNTEASYDRLDTVLTVETRARGLAYLSQDRLFGLEFPRDLGGCDGLLWSDGDHYSAKGEVVFGRRADVVAAALDRLSAP